MASTLLVTARAGTTDPLDFQLNGKDAVSGDVSVYDLTGVTAIELHLQNASGVVTTFTLASGKISVTDAANGRVRFSPGSTDLVYQTRAYDAWFKVTNASGKVLSFPSDSNFRLQVVTNF